MGRDDLYVTVPSFFKCPISLDVMKSPVSLCTGVTYDRSSIQRWLDSGNNTCPATMQVLQSKEFVPNQTLQRLIKVWSDSVQHHLSGGDRVDSSHNSVSWDQLESIFKDIEQNEEVNPCFDALTKIMSFAEETEENREFLAKMDGFLPMLVDFLGNYDDDNVAHKNIDFIEEVTRVLDMILIKIGDHEQLMILVLKNDKRNLDCLSSLLLVLQQGSLHSRIASVRILKSIAIDSESKLLVAEKEGLLPELVKSINLDSDPSLIEASLILLVSISMPKCVKLKLLHLNSMAALQKLLTASSNNGNVWNSITEKALKLLEMVSSCKEGRAEMCCDTACIEAVMHKVLKVSGEAAEHAVTILWTVCYLLHDQRAQEAVTRNNGLTKILLLMQSNCSPGVKQMSSDLLKIFRVNSNSCLCSYDTKTTHIMPF